MQRRPMIAVLGALGCLAALVVVWAIAFLLPLGHSLDAATLTGFVDLDSASVNPAASHISSLAHPQAFLLAAAVLTAVALARGRMRVAAVVPVVLLGANFTSQLLKPALASPRFSDLPSDVHINAAAWPSGHATAAMSIALCAVLVASPRLRPFVAAVGGAFAVAVAYSILTLAWHFPSDVLGGFLVAALWMAMGVAALWGAAARWPERSGRGRAAAVRVRDALAPSGLAAALAVGCAAAILLARPDRTLAFAQQHTVFVAGAAAIAALGAALAAALAVALRA